MTSRPRGSSDKPRFPKRARGARPYRHRRPNVKSGTPTALQDLIGAWSSRQQKLPDYRLSVLKMHWAELVGVRLAQKTRPVSLRADELVIVVATSSWVNELTFLRKQLIEQINKRLDQTNAVSRVRFIVGRVDRD